jgi:hypothetical protein
MQLAKRLPMEDSDFIQKLRVGYVAAQIISLAIYFYIQMQVSLRVLVAVSSVERGFDIDPARYRFHALHHPRSRERTTSPP